MKVSLFDFLRGRVRVNGEKSKILKLVNLMSEYNIPLAKFRVFDDYAYFDIYLSNRRYVDAICVKYKIEVKYETRGLPRILDLYKKRAGIFAGIILGIALILISNLFVWSVEIVGNEEIPDDVILECLERNGLRPGTFKKSADIHLIAVNAELEIDRLAWLAVNYKGTHAIVEVKETSKKPEIIDYKTPTNLVAKCDGHILYVETLSGQAAVVRGNTVEKGNLLIGGIVDSKTLGYKKVRALGKVLAETTHTYEKTVPLKSEMKIYTGKTNSEKTVSIFGLSFDIGKKCGFKNADVTQKRENAVVFSEIVLPIEIKEKLSKEYNIGFAEISEKDAEAEALRLIEEEISDELSGAEITAREENKTVNDGKVTVKVTLSCIEDICTEVLLTTVGEDDKM